MKTLAVKVVSVHAVFSLSVHSGLCEHVSITALSMGQMKLNVRVKITSDLKRSNKATAES